MSSTRQLEQRLDAEFERMDIRPRIYHFVGGIMHPYRAITIATVFEFWTWESLSKEIAKRIAISQAWSTNATTKLKRKLESIGLYPAICDLRDTFNRQRGRIIAKGRLLKHLKQEAKA